MSTLVQDIQTLPFDRAHLWAAYSSRDARFDGQFVAGVRTTGIYCRPSCSCRRPRPERVEYLLSAEAAERAGYRPCKRCRPELPGGAPEADRRFAEQVLAVMRVRLSEPMSLDELAAAVGASTSSFAHRFRAIDGRTPMEALRDLRVERARALLVESELPVLHIALRAGFQSLSAFTRAFRQRTGVSPSAWRTRHRRAAGALAHASVVPTPARGARSDASGRPGLPPEPGIGQAATARRYSTLGTNRQVAGPSVRARPPLSSLSG
jgi:methylphosphotriester-DNA--protein-cysteine methyltransferase